MRIVKVRAIASTADLAVAQRAEAGQSATSAFAQGFGEIVCYLKYYQGIQKIPTRSGLHKELNRLGHIFFISSVKISGTVGFVNSKQRGIIEAMTRELEPTGRFRVGENPGRPYGGNVSPEPFPQALYALACSRGYESQLSLAHALCQNNNTTVSTWYRGIDTPTPDQLGKILRLLQPNDQELDALLEPYGKLLEQGRGQGYAPAGSEAARKVGVKSMRQPKTPLEDWIKKFCQEKQLTLEKVFTRLGFASHTFGRQTRFGLPAYSEILQRAQKTLNLSEEEANFLGEAVAQTIEQKIAAGHTFTSKPGGGLVRRMQKKLVCTTYNGEQAGKELGIGRERVRQLREILNLPLLLTAEQLALLQARKEVYKKFKRKIAPDDHILIYDQ